MAEPLPIASFITMEALMKTLIFTSVLLFGTCVLAQGQWITREQKQRSLQCTVSECRNYTNTELYFEWCNWQRKSNVGRGTDSPVWQLRLPSNQYCNCPCDMGFEHRVRTGASNSQTSLTPRFQHA